jgi:translation initiation factor IF-3
LFRGREISRPELGRAILNRVMEQLDEVAVQEQAPQLSGRDLNMIVGSKKDAKAQNS